MLNDKQFPNWLKKIYRSNTLDESNVPPEDESERNAPLRHIPDFFKSILHRLAKLAKSATAPDGLPGSIAPFTHLSALVVAGVLTGAICLSGILVYRSLRTLPTSNTTTEPSVPAQTAMSSHAEPNEDDISLNTDASETAHDAEWKADEPTKKRATKRRKGAANGMDRNATNSGTGEEPGGASAVFPVARPPVDPKALPPGPDPFQKLTRWVGTNGQKQNYRFIIEERTDDAIKGYLQEVKEGPVKINLFGPNGQPRLHFAGTVEKGELNFQIAMRDRSNVFFKGKLINGTLNLTSTAEAKTTKPSPGSSRRATPRKSPTETIKETWEFTFDGMNAASYHELKQLSEVVDATDTEVVAQELSRLLSFPLYFPADGRRTPITGSLWLPSSNVSFTTARTTETENAVCFRLRDFSERGPAKWQAHVKEAQAIVTARLKLARFDSRYGNTPGASLTRDFPKFMFGLQESLKEVEKAFEKDELEKRTLPSLDSLRALKRLQFKGSKAQIEKILTKDAQDNGLPPPTQVSKYMRRADVEMAHAQSEFWAQYMVPALNKAIKTKVKASLVEVTPQWSSFDDKQALGLSVLEYTNISDKPLTNVVLEIQLANEFDEKTAVYHYIEYWSPGEKAHGMLHEAWGDERTFHMQNFKGQVSYWSDQGKLLNTKLNFENAKLTTRAKELRKNWLDWDAETLEPSKIWGTVAQSAIQLPTPKRP